MPLDFDLTDEQQMLRTMVRNFTEKEIAPIAQELDDKEEFSYPLTKRMGDLGLFGPFVPEEYGGSNVGYISYIIAVEEIARIDGSQAATLAAGNSLGISPIYYYGNEGQKKRWLLMKEYPVERHYRNQKLLDIGEGTSEVQRIVIARHIGVPGRAL